MEVSDQHVDFIQGDLESRGITLTELNESLVDHICCALEQSKKAKFIDAYLEIIQGFGQNELPLIQKQTKFLLISKKSMTMKKVFYLLGFLAAFLTSTGILFRMQHWPGAGVILVLGIALFNFGFLPIYFYNRYKNA